jgi:acyl-CoA thioesterase
MIQQARNIFAADRYATDTTGISIDHVADHEAVCSLTVGALHCNARGVAMGGTLFTLADFAAAIAANTDCIADGNLHWVSLDSAIHYLSPAPLGILLKATAQAVKQGRTTALYQTTIERPDNGHKIALVETTMIFV